MERCCVRAQEGFFDPPTKCTFCKFEISISRKSRPPGVVNLGALGSVACGACPCVAWVGGVGSTRFKIFTPRFTRSRPVRVALGFAGDFNNSDNCFPRAPTKQPATSQNCLLHSPASHRPVLRSSTPLRPIDHKYICLCQARCFTLRRPALFELGGHASTRVVATRSPVAWTCCSSRKISG